MEGRDFETARIGWPIRLISRPSLPRSLNFASARAGARRNRPRSREQPFRNENARSEKATGLGKGEISKRANSVDRSVAFLDRRRRALSISHLRSWARVAFPGKISGELPDFPNADHSESSCLWAEARPAKNRPASATAIFRNGSNASAVAPAACQFRISARGRASPIPGEVVCGGWRIFGVSAVGPPESSHSGKGALAAKKRLARRRLRFRSLSNASPRPFPFSVLATALSRFLIRYVLRGPQIAIGCCRPPNSLRLNGEGGRAAAANWMRQRRHRCLSRKSG